MKLIIILITAAAMAVSSSGGAPSSSVSKLAAAGKPNILVILADDLGYADLGCQGGKDVPTPNIDGLAREGIRFTSGYVTAPVCGPSRAGLMSGRYGERFGFEGNIGPDREGVSPSGVPVTEKIFPERMKAAGYATGMFGKWHLGYAPAMQPLQRGFDWYFGFLSADRSYRINVGELGKSLLKNPAKPLEYTTDAFAAEAAAFIEQHRNQPWFVYLPFNAVHASPKENRHLILEDGGQYVTRFQGIKDEQRRIFAGMLSAMDEGVGVVLAKLRELNLEENTLVFFLSDNGGPTWQTTSRNDPLRGSKGHLTDGGIREPFIIRWKGHLPAGRVDDRPIISLDIQPTALAAIGAPIDPTLEGENLLPYLNGEKSGAPHDILCWRYLNRRAIRMGDWKLTDDDGEGFKLYNLANDIAEATDLSTQEPAKVKELQAAYNDWNSRNIAPLWGSETGKARKGKGKSSPQARAARMENDQ